MTRIAVVAFPGTNCMLETRDALLATGARAEIITWNASAEHCTEFDAFVIAGGFSYEDRIRAGAIAAKHRLLDVIASAAEDGKPVLGVCNGAQILVEAGLVPGIEQGRIEVVLAPNAAPQWSGYYCDWVHLRVTSALGILEGVGSSSSTLPMPVGNGEGRFTGDADFLAELDRRGQIALRYVAPDGRPAQGYPDNPNASWLDAAGICDPTGRILAMMPHPERAAWLYQVPEDLPGEWGRERRAARSWKELASRGPGLQLYECFVRAARKAAVKP